jgi:hypothetical protein
MTPTTQTRESGFPGVKLFQRPRLDRSRGREATRVAFKRAEVAKTVFRVRRNVFVPASVRVWPIATRPLIFSKLFSPAVPMSNHSGVLRQTKAWLSPFAVWLLPRATPVSLTLERRCPNPKRAEIDHAGVTVHMNASEVVRCRRARADDHAVVADRIGDADGAAQRPRSAGRRPRRQRNA